MRVFLDACVDPRAAEIFAGHEVKTAVELGWHGLKDHLLLNFVEEQFDTPSSQSMGASSISTI